MGCTEGRLVCNRNGATERRHCYVLSSSTSDKDRVSIETKHHPCFSCTAPPANPLEPVICYHHVRRRHLDCPRICLPTTQTTVLFGFGRAIHGSGSERGVRRSPVPDCTAEQRVAEVVQGYGERKGGILPRVYRAIGPKRLR